MLEEIWMVLCLEEGWIVTRRLDCLKNVGRRFDGLMVGRRLYGWENVEWFDGWKEVGWMDG